MERIFVPEDFGKATASSFIEAEVVPGAPTTYWLIAHVQKVLRAAERRCGTSQAAWPEGPSPLRDASVHLDVAAAIYRLLLERGGSDTVSLSDCLGRACAAMLEPLGISARASFEFYCEPNCTIPAADALPVAAIAVEAVTNALRHAHPAGLRGRLSIACRRKGNAIVMEVGDDGVGLPEGFKLGRDAGAGLGTVVAMADEIGAGLSLDSRPLGMTLRLTLPADGSASP